MGSTLPVLTTDERQKFIDILTLMSSGEVGIDKKRIALIPLSKDNEHKALVGEIILDRTTGWIGVRNDEGQIISKFDSIDRILEDFAAFIGDELNPIIDSRINLLFPTLIEAYLDNNLDERLVTFLETYLPGYLNSYLNSHLAGRISTYLDTNLSPRLHDWCFENIGTYIGAYLDANLPSRILNFLATYNVGDNEYFFNWKDKIFVGSCTPTIEGGYGDYTLRSLLPSTNGTIISFPVLKEDQTGKAGEFSTTIFSREIIRFYSTGAITTPISYSWMAFYTNNADFDETTSPYLRGEVKLSANTEELLDVTLPVTLSDNNYSLLITPKNPTEAKLGEIYITKRNDGFSILVTDTPDIDVTFNWVLIYTGANIPASDEDTFPFIIMRATWNEGESTKVVNLYPGMENKRYPIFGQVTYDAEGKFGEFFSSNRNLDNFELRRSDNLSVGISDIIIFNNKDGAGNIALWDHITGQVLGGISSPYGDGETRTIKLSTPLPDTTGTMITFPVNTEYEYGKTGEYGGSVDSTSIINFYSTNNIVNALYTWAIFNTPNTDFNETTYPFLRGSFYLTSINGPSITSEDPILDGNAQWMSLDTPAWEGSHEYSLNDLCTNDSGKLYICTLGGMSATEGGPTGNAETEVVDGNAKWLFVETPAWTKNTIYSEDDYCTNNSIFYKCLVGGLSMTDNTIKVALGETLTTTKYVLAVSANAPTNGKLGEHNVIKYNDYFNFNFTGEFEEPIKLSWILIYIGDAAPAYNADTFPFYIYQLDWALNEKYKIVSISPAAATNNYAVLGQITSDVDGSFGDFYCSSRDINSCRLERTGSSGNSTDIIIYSK